MRPAPPFSPFVGWRKEREDPGVPDGGCDAVADSTTRSPSDPASATRASPRWDDGEVTAEIRQVVAAAGRSPSPPPSAARGLPLWDDGDVTAEIRQAVVGAAPNGSVLFEYADQVTDPRMPASGGPLGRVRVQPAPMSDRGLKRALSAQTVPTWTESNVIETGRPSTPSSEAGELLRARGAGLEGTLTVLRGDRSGRVVSLSTRQIVMGRSPNADLHLMDHGVSRRHARVCWVDGRFALQDLGSRNGTFVRDQVVDTVALEHGDVIRLGPNAAVRFCWMDSHQKQLLEELFETSVRDPLTGSYNRRHFVECLRTEIAYANRHDGLLSLLILDVDHFKSINDRHGHPEGDRVLREMARLGQRAIRTEDVFARYGGEEFAALLRGISLEGAVRAAERLRDSFRRNISVGDPPSQVTVSVGCASLGCIEERTASRLVQLADRRLYQAKQAGRDCVVATGC